MWGDRNNFPSRSCMSAAAIALNLSQNYDAEAIDVWSDIMSKLRRPSAFRNGASVLFAGWETALAQRHR